MRSSIAFVVGRPGFVLGSTVSCPDDHDHVHVHDDDLYVADIPTSANTIRPDYSCRICTLHIASQDTP
ncbi:hypothetical protein LY78DRAFT_681062 [Colletotrichum sublineola]|nr:hypothetical protein LY78DRAFT_681062 [Colletotrichum sublineola]